MKDVVNLILELAEENVNIYLEDSKLKIDTPGGMPVDDIIARIRPNRERIIEYLSTARTRKTATIPNAVVQKDYPVSSSQRRLWILSQLQEASIAYNMPAAFVFTGNIDRVALEKAFAIIVERHEILRTVFTEAADGSIRQVVREAEEMPVVIKYYDLRYEINRDQKVNELLEESSVIPFDLSNGPLLRQSLIRLEDEKWIFQYTMHHLISDGWSMGIFIKELLYAYNSYVQGITPLLPGLEIQYKDYASWQQQELTGNTLGDHKKYWLQKFEGDLPVLELPADNLRPAIKSYSGDIVTKTINSSLAKEIKELGNGQGATLFMTLLAAVNTLLHRYTGQEDIIIGSPVAGRQHADLEGQIGAYINTLPLRTKFSGKETFKNLLNIVKKTALSAFDHQAYPFDELVEHLNIRKDMSRNALFDVMVVLQNADAGRKSIQNNLGSLQIEPYTATPHVISKFDLLFDFSEQGDEFKIGIEYNTAIYNRTSIERMAGHFEQMLAAIASAPETPIGFLDYLSVAEEKSIVAALDASNVTYNQYETLVSLFEQQVTETPGNIAVKLGERTLAYSQLNELVNRFADYLQKQHGIKREDLVVVKLEKSEWMIVSLLAVLKACAAYVPVDPAYPQDRIDYMISDSGCKLIIDENEIENFKAVAEAYSHDNPVAQPLPSDLAYVIYTSGTTGLPKGSLVEHGNLTRLFKNDQSLFDFDASDVWTMFHSFCFDFSVWEMYGALLFGGKLIIIPSEVSKDPARYLDILTEERVTVLNQTPSSFYNVIRQEMERPEALLNLRYVIFGGEALSPVKLKEWSARYPSTQLINMYGITETTVHVTYKKITGIEIESNSSNIGKPIPTLSCYVLDANRQLLPYGVPGELYVGGKGVCRGYLNRPDLTALRFVENPFSKQEKLYRSGDKVRLLETGELQYEGRIDEQVKVRGYRIELGEIQNVLAAHEQVESSVVITRDNEAGEKELIAYIVGKGELNIAELRRHLGRQLPSYMLPHHFVEVQEIPLTSNGKVDTKRLPEVQGTDISSGVEYVAPTNETEGKMCAIWQQVLGREKIGLAESFFELGGDSIKVLRMLTEVRKVLGINLSITDVYSKNTIAELLAHYHSNKSGISQNEQTTQDGKAQVQQQFDELRNEILALQTGEQRSNIEDVYPMSDIEKGMVYESLMADSANVYNCISVQRKRFADFDIDRFRLSLQLMVQKHSILRTGFNMDDYSVPVQVVYRDLNYEAAYRDISAFDATEQTTIIRDHIENLQQLHFNFLQPPLWSMTVFNLGDNEIVFIFQAHHAIVDGWSVASFTTELNNVYHQLGEDNSYKPQALQSSYKDFVIQHEFDKTNEPVKDFWRNELLRFERLDLFTQKNRNENYASTLPSEFFEKLKIRSQEWNTSIKLISLSAYLYMMKVLGHTNDVVIGLVTNNRPPCEDGDKIIGCFLNTVPLRIAMDRYQSPEELISAVQSKITSLKAYETLSTIEIASLHNEQSGGNPFFDVLFNYVDFHVYNSIVNDSVENDESQVDTGLLANYGSANTYFDFTVDISGNKFLTDVLLRKELKSGLTAERIASLYYTILSYMLDYPRQLLNQAELATEQEKQLLLFDFNNTQADFPADQTIFNLFESKAEQYPSKVALVFENTALTYDELNKVSNQFADYLRKNYEILGNDLVGLMLPRSEWMIISMLAILKAGGGYVPIDPDYPQERIAYMVADSNCRLVITEQEIDIFREQQHLYSQENLPVINKPADLAYVIYTSGSTGNPKGVMIEHRSVVNLITSQRERFGIDETENILQFSSISFDASVEQIFLALTSGATLTIPSKEIVTDAEQLRAFIIAHHITHIHMVPGILSSIVTEKYEHLRRIIAGGDACSKELAQNWSLHHQFYNEYGPTETAITSIEHLYGETEPSDVLPIGKPVANTFVYIVNEGGRLLPPGMPGEICIGGAGVARGYLDRVELTAEKFVGNPFRAGERMYKTGDLGRWLHNGTIEFIGRLDEQVKIRGYRIELGEIESVISQHESVASVAVTAVAREKERELVAYVVSNGILNKAVLRAFLQEKLPAYMVPAYIIELPALPLSVNGKIDRKRLPHPSDADIAGNREYIAPRNQTEEKLLEIWSEVLSVEKENISVKDNFFELGGHSLKATRLAGQLYRAFDVKLDLKELFLRPEIEQQALLIEQAIKSEFFSIAEAEPAESYPLSASQRRLWVLSQFEAANAAYNIAGANVFEGKLDRHALSYSFSMLLARHESLRTVFRETASGETRQFILSKNEIDFSIDYRDLREHAGADQYVRELVEQDFARSFDLAHGPLLRASLYQVDDERWILSYVMHHIISDGWSMQVLIRELLSFYKSYVDGDYPGLKDLRIQYKDYAVWQQQQLSGEKLQVHRSYWLEHFSGVLPVVDLPSDKPRPAVKTYSGALSTAGINAGLYKGLQLLSQQQGTTLFMSLLGVVNVLLYKYTAQEDIIIGTPVAVREHPDLEDQIGFYANTLALRTQFSGSDNFYELLDRVKKMTLGAYEHQVYPFDQLVGDLQLIRDRSRHPLFDIQVILQNDDADADTVESTTDLWMKQYPPAPVIASVFDIVFNFHEGKNGLYVTITYNSDVYSRALIGQLGKHLEQITQSILDAPEAAISNLQFLNAEERDELVEIINDTEVAYDDQATLVSLFSKQVLQTPGETAVVYENRSMSYAELNTASGRLANYLESEYKISQDDKIAVMLDRSDYFIIAILGILKSGAAYVPVDAHYPASRKEFILKDTGAKALLTQTDHLFSIDYYNGPVFAMDVQLGLLDNNKFIESAIDPHSLAYVIYTSGSTGEPKGVMIEHAAIANTIQSQQSIFNVETGYHHLQFASSSFDASVSEIFVALCSGGSLYIISDEEKKDPQRFIQFIKNNSIGIATIPPAYLQLLELPDLKILKRLITAGEAAVKNKVQSFSDYGDYYNAYGPTETSICATVFKNAKGNTIDSARVPIGFPIANTRIYIINQDESVYGGVEGRLCAKGVPGEIYVSGRGVARGYLNREELTDEKFMDDPFRKGYRMYRTGDRGRWTENGALEFLGRNDEQVKLRGYRIEPGEIENVLQKYEHIQQAAVTVQSNEQGEQELIAFIVSKETKTDIAALRNYLAQSLPAYMLPHHYVELEELPLNHSGKVDKSRLPAVKEQSLTASKEFIGARTDVEAAVIPVYEEVLKKKPIGIKDDFFVLGGDSIKSIQVVSRLKQKGYSLTIQDVLVHPVVEELCRVMGIAARTTDQSPEEGIISLSPIQRYFFESSSASIHHYNQSILLKAKLRLSEEGLQQCFGKLVAHHDALRMTYRFENGEWIQENLGLRQGFGWEVIEVANDEQLQQYCDTVQSSIDLANGPLMKVCLFRGNDQQPDHLLIVIHHLVIDGVSWRIILEDLSELYDQFKKSEALELPLKTDSFAAWQKQQERYAASYELQQEELYWDETERKAFSAAPLQADNDGSNTYADIEHAAFVMNKHTTDLLIRRCYYAYRTGINDLLVAALATAMKDVFNINKLLLKLEGHGREDIGGNMDVTRTVGWFTTTYPVVIDLHDGNLQDQLIEVKECLHAVPNKGIGYGILRYFRNKPYACNPSVSFNYLGDFGQGAETKSGDRLFDFSELNRGHEVNNERERDVLLDVSGVMAEGCLRIGIGYSSAQFSKERMQELLNAYRESLEALITWLSQEEKQYITPSDLTYKKLSIAELAELNREGNVEDVYELSPLQEGLYYHWLSAKDEAAYFMQTSCAIQGVLDVNLLSESYSKLVERYGVLRSHFTQQSGVMLQVVKKYVNPAFEYFDISAENDIQQCIEEYKQIDRERGFDLSSGSQMRLMVLNLGNDRYEFIWSHHHILMDGWCGGILIKEFFTIYDSLVDHREVPLNPVKGYAEYIQWLRGINKNASLEYWREYLQGYETVNRLWEPRREPGGQSKNYTALKREFDLPLSLASGIKTMSAAMGVTESNFVQVVWAVLMGKYTGSNDVVFGSVVSGRPAELQGVEDMIGLFSNTVPVRITWNENSQVSELLKQAQQNWIAGSTHHYVQLAEVQAQSAVGRDLFNQVMVIENFPVQEMLQQSTEGSGGLSFLSSDIFDQTNYDFTLTVRPGGERLHLRIDCDANLYEEEQVAKLQEHFIRMAEQVIANPFVNVDQLELLSNEERNELLHVFNATEILYDTSATLVSLFEKQVHQTPDETAVVFEGRSFSYKQLNEQSDRLAWHLHNHYKIVADELVSVMMKRSDHMLIAILAILKAGAAYVPVDVDYPRNRKEFILNDSASRIVLTESEYMFELDFYGGEVFAIDIQSDGLTNPPGGWKLQVHPSSLAYVIYTSGSTGQPKGVMIEHRAIANTIQSQQSIFDVHPNFHHLQFASSSFDASVSEIFVALCSGGSLYIISEADKKDTASLKEFIDRNNIDIATIPPAYMQLLEASDLKILKRLITAGEAAVKNKVQSFSAYGDYYNAYGPTETSICATVFKNPEGYEIENARVPIGRPIANTQVYILNEHMQLCAKGIPGEICVSGPGLARGYWNQQELTEQKFVADPFNHGQRMYRTGDVGRWLADGNIEFLGRKDEQVKIRGYRIETGEIESVLQSSGHIVQSVAVVHENAGTQQLVAYIVSNNGAVDINELREHAAKWLPVYMLPDHYVQLHELPLNRSGKIDKAALPLPDGSAAGSEYVAPRTEIENNLVEIWSEVLGLDKEKIGVRDNFFNLGGHSLKVIQLMARVRKQFEVNPGIDSLFKNPTIEFLAGEIEKTQLVNAGSPELENADNIENFHV